ncbi:MAG: AbrB/MazE/SpoVT family DNA-binding domain-containing protein [Pseudomonadota bacterium]
MPKVSAKRQITLPIEQCQALGIEPGDEVESFVADGQLTIVKKVAGAAKGILRHVQPVRSMTDEESRQSAIK